MSRITTAFVMLAVLGSAVAAQAGEGPIRIAVIVDPRDAECLTDEMLKSIVRVVYDRGGSVALGGMDGVLSRVDLPAPPRNLLAAPDLSRLNAFAKSDSTRAFNSRVDRARTIEALRRDLARTGLEELRRSAAAIRNSQSVGVVRGTRAALVYLAESGTEQAQYLVAVTPAVEPSRQSSSRLEVPNINCQAIVVNSDGESGVLMKLKPRLASSLAGALAIIKQEVE